MLRPLPPLAWLPLAVSWTCEHLCCAWSDVLGWAAATLVLLRYCYRVQAARTQASSHQWQIVPQWQEIPENAADTAHLAFLHGPAILGGSDLRYTRSKLWDFMKHIWKVRPLLAMRRSKSFKPCPHSASKHQSHFIPSAASSHCQVRSLFCVSGGFSCTPSSLLISRWSSPLRYLPSACAHHLLD